MEEPHRGQVCPPAAILGGSYNRAAGRKRTKLFRSREGAHIPGVYASAMLSYAAMRDLHEFVFDVDKAFADQLLEALEASPVHPLTDPQAVPESGVYVLYQDGKPVYVGQAVGARGVAARLVDHRKKIEHRTGISVSEIACRYLLIQKKWEVSRAETAIIEKYKPAWNGIPGFSMHVAGAGRPGMPGYASQWDKLFPRLP